MTLAGVADSSVRPEFGGAPAQRRAIERPVEACDNTQMDGKVLYLAKELQLKLEAIDPAKDRDALVWAHGFLTSILQNVKGRVPELITSKTLLQETAKALESLTEARTADLRSDNLDSLEQIGRELEESDEAGVPARHKPGPKGRSGGIALPLPESDRPM